MEKSRISRLLTVRSGVSCAILAVMMLGLHGMAQRGIVTQLERYYDAFEDAVECKQTAFFDDFDSSLVFIREDGVLSIVLFDAEADVLELGVLSGFPNSERVDLTLLWPNTGDRVTLRARGTVITLDKYSQQVRIDDPPIVIFYQLANSGSDVPYRIAGERGGEHDGLIPQSALNGLQEFTTACMD